MIAINIVLSTAGQIKEVQRGTSRFALLNRNSFMSGMHVTKLPTASTQQHCGWHLFLFDGRLTDRRYELMVVCAVMPSAK